MRQRGNIIKNPYTACRVLMILESFSQKGYEEDKEPMMSPTIPRCDFTVVESIGKLLEIQRFATAQNPNQKLL